MDKEGDFTCYQKMLIFGAESTGKTTLTNCLHDGSSTEEQPNQGGIYFINLFNLNYLLNRYFLY